MKRFYCRDTLNDIRIENPVLSTHCIVARAGLDIHVPPESRGNSLQQVSTAWFSLRQDSARELAAAELLICHAKDLSQHSKNLLLLYQLP